MLKHTAATATLAACVIAVLTLVGPFLGHTPFESPAAYFAPEHMFENWIR